MNIPEQYLQALVAISEEINSIQEPAALLNRILEIALRELSAERGFILLRDEESGELTPHAAWNLAPDAISDIREISSTAVESVLRDQKSILTFDTDTDGKFDQSQSVVLNKIRSIACVPLRQKGRVIGVIYMDSRGQKARFTQQSLAFLDAFANASAIALENARLLESLRRENESLREEFHRVFAFKEILGHSPSMERVFQMMGKVLNNSTTVLVNGETGTGKELIARAIHYNGIRKNLPFLAVN